MATVIALTVKLDGVEKAITNTDELKDAIKATNKELGQVEIGSDAYKELDSQLGALRETQKDLRADTREAGRQFKIAADEGKDSYRALNAELVSLRKEFKDLDREARESEFGEALVRRIQELDEELKAIDKTIGLNQRNVGDYAQALAGLGGIDLSNLLTGVGLVTALGTAAANSATFVSELTKEVSAFRNEVALLTDETGDNLDNITSRIIAIGQTFDKDYKEVLISANTVAKQFGISQQEALDLIEKGFVNGADASDEFLDSLREYPTFFDEAGLSAQTLVNTIQQSVSEGIFSDKGVDAVKEAALSLRELPQTAQDALSQIGISSEDIAAKINEDGIGGAIALVSETLGQFEDDSKEVGVVIADIFKGAGEDAGVDFIKSLKDIDKATEDTVGELNEYQKKQLETIQVNKEFAAVQVEVANAFGEFQADIDLASTQLKTQLLKILVEIIKGFVTFKDVIASIPAFIKENTAAFALLTAGLVTLNFTTIATAAAQLRAAAVSRVVTIATNAQALAQKALNIVLKANPIGLIITAVGLLITGFNEATKRSEKFRATIAGLSAVAKEVFTIIKEAVGSFVDGFNELKDGNFTEAFKAFGDGLVKSNPIGIALTQGKRLGDAFNEGFDGSIEESQAAKSVEESLEGVGDATEETTKKTEKLNDAVKESTNTLTALNTQLSELKERREKVDLGSDEFDNLTKQINDTQKKIDDALGVTRRKAKAVAADSFATGSIAALSKTIADLRKELNEAPEEQAAVILPKLINAEAELEKAKQIQQQIRESLVQGLEAQTLEGQVELNIDEINTRRAISHKALIETILNDEEELAERTKIVNLNSDIAVLEEKLKLVNEEGVERFELEREIAEKVAELNRTRDESSLNDRIAAVEQEGAIRIEAARQAAETDEEFQREREIIALQTEQRIAALKLEGLEVGSNAQLELAQEIADKEVEINALKNEAIIEQEEEKAEILMELSDQLFDATGAAINLVDEAGRIRFENEMNELEERYEREIELAEGNTEEQERLREELAAEQARLEEEEFKRQKRIQIATALNSAAQGIVNILSAPSTIPDPFGTIFKVARIAFLTATTAAQIANINSRQAAEGILVESDAEKTPQGKKAIGRLTGATHLSNKSGKVDGIPINVLGQKVLVEHGEFFDFDENGNAVVINKRSAAVFNDELEAVKGLDFDGKREYLSGINSFKGFGIPFMQDGGVITPNVVAATRSTFITQESDGTVVLSDDAINLIAVQVGKAVERGAAKGTAQGANDANRERERQAELEERESI